MHPPAADVLGASQIDENGSPPTTNKKAYPPFDTLPKQERCVLNQHFLLDYSFLRPRPVQDLVTD